MDLPRAPRFAEADPGWALALLARPAFADPLELVAGRPWWSALSTRAAEALDRLWRHGVAAACAARRLAAEAGDPDPEHVGRVALVHRLGLWAVAALDPEAMADLLALDPARRRAEERARLGLDASALGRTLAERWGLPPEVAEAAWLHADRGLDACGEATGRLGLIHQAAAQAERTPWALDGPHPADPGPPDPRLRLLIAEVQVRTGTGLVEPDATSHEERLARAHAALLLRVAEAERASAARERFLRTFVAADPAEPPDAWADRAALAWCAEPGVAAARVVPLGRPSAPEGAGSPDPSPAGPRAPALALPFGRPGAPSAELHLWPVPDAAPLDPTAHPAWAAWNHWAALVAERDRLARRLDTSVEVHRARADHDGRALRQDRLAALAEFAAGAGHELNNPLAVIVGRAQLLLARSVDPTGSRDLRAIIAQAQRAHRLLRDLMYVARPPEPRPRLCAPDDVLRACVRDLQGEADDRGVRVVVEARSAGGAAWADPEPLRHLAETLLRNALEATPRGGTVRVVSAGAPHALAWQVRDSGRGIGPEEGRHLFDPFFCGRQAGRGLGLGLPRAARFVALAGGDLTWRSSPGHGSVFNVHLPLSPPPAPADEPARAGRVPAD